MSFLHRVLDRPSYGMLREGVFYKPTSREMFGEFFSRLNLLKSRRAWLPLLAWTASAALAIPFMIFLTRHFSWSLLLLGMTYSMVWLGTYGTIYLHRYSTHRAFQFSNPAWRFVVRNLSIKVVPEEVYVISHHVHHLIPEKAGDPYNVNGGGLYCFLADVNHQQVARNLSERDYSRLALLMEHTGVKVNTYAQYQKWGSICHPARTVLHFALNWTFWYGIFFWIGGHALATAIFGCSVIWAFGIRTYNYDGHGRGVDKRRAGVDFNTEDLSVNQLWPGFVAGEWHNNHHLYPNGVRSGFLPYQLDTAWLVIKSVDLLGGIASYRDYKEDFYRDHYLPYLEAKKKKAEAETAPALS
jgi:sn-1 stearoyl-lipid 9-desaturase